MRAESIIAALFVALSFGCASAPTRSVDPVSAVPKTANISGNWLITVESRGGAIPGNMVIVQDGTNIRGTIKSDQGKVDLVGSLNGDTVKFSYGVEQFGAPAGTVFDYTGTVTGETMHGNATFSTFGEGQWFAKRP